MAERERKKRDNAEVDENSKESFPASDPPSYSGGTGVGAPPRLPDDGKEDDGEDEARKRDK